MTETTEPRLRRFAQRLGVAVIAFALAWLAAALTANWLFGSGNILVWVIATCVAVGAYVALLLGDRRSVEVGPK